MLTSMTGFGRGETVHSTEGGATITVTAEIRSVNSRFIEISVRTPRTLSERELDLREAVRKRLERGKISVNVSIERQGTEALPLTINEPMARAYFNLLDKLRTATGLTAEIQLRDLTSFGDIFQGEDTSATAAKEEWGLTQQALEKAILDLTTMRQQEGRELERDLRERLKVITGHVDEVEKLAKTTAAEEYAKLKERVLELTQDIEVLNNQRLELEIAMIAERLDVTEEIVRFRSHLKFFLEAMESPEAAGRKLNFILQEMNREVNTIGSKTNQADVAHHVVLVKQELEKIREQVQNLE
ncbi:MAG: YicC/YloC family endoribonuclease [Bacteroidota bacterium]|nr:YicC/YloC family endoribonuclease [Bacteroidota bacterium]MDP4233696.1 YicC/YloC family endoribonuclease [Bacteroidota bacterium]MDP4242335.1 YicC/YloC family endoribonuclease [Bacteroidota bacterium]MDP4288713.1 YicC/YloC family endoribonuclease [Bacteroidota bacterium]